MLMPGKRIVVALAFSLPLSLAPARAEAGDSTPLRFVVTLAPEIAGSPCRNGRLLVVLGQPERGEPRLTIGQTGVSASPVLGRDVAEFSPGAQMIVDERSIIFPIAHLSMLPPGDYAAQAVLHTNPDLNVRNAPGDLYGPARTVRIDPQAGGTIALELSRAIPGETLPPDTELVRYVKVQSRLLSAFHGRPIYLRAGVILPRDFAHEPGRRYPLRVHIGGYGARYTEVGQRMARGTAFDDLWMADATPRLIFVQLDGAGPLGDPYQVNSANNGPYGDAITQELIPEVERMFRGIGRGDARVLDGGSTGGWVALALQIFYPDFWCGAWSFCPDSVDFRSLQLVNIYDDENAYLNRHGFERPAARDVSGEVRYTMRHECGLENVLGRGDSWTMSGAQWGAWNATFGPRGRKGPIPIWGPRTGVIDHTVAQNWKSYDLRSVLEENWQDLGPRLRGKLHIWVGEADDFFLNNAVHHLDQFLSSAQPAYEGSITFVPGRGHTRLGISEAEMMMQMARRMGAALDSR
jgi:hypothetical protein